MKNTLWAAVAAAMMMALGLARIHAQEEVGPGGPQAGSMWDQMKDKLGLSDDQLAKLKQAHQLEEADGRNLRRKVSTDMKRLQEQVNSKASDAEIQSTLDALKADRSAMQAQMDKNRDESESLLTPTQRAKLILEMSSQRHQQMGPRGPGGKKVEPAK